MEDVLRFLLCLSLRFWFLTALLCSTTSCCSGKKAASWYTFSFCSAFCYLRYLRIRQLSSTCLSLWKEQLVAACSFLQLSGLAELLALSARVYQRSLLFFRAAYLLMGIYDMLKMYRGFAYEFEVTHLSFLPLQSGVYLASFQQSFLKDVVIDSLDFASINFSFTSVLSPIMFESTLLANTSMNNLLLILNRTAVDEVITPPHSNFPLFSIYQQPQTSSLPRIINGRCLFSQESLLQRVISPQITMYRNSGVSPSLKTTEFLVNLWGLLKSSIRSISICLMFLNSQMFERKSTFYLSSWYLKWPEKVLQKVSRSSSNTQVLLETDLAECSFWLWPKQIFYPKCSLAPIFWYSVGAERGSSALLTKTNTVPVMTQVKNLSSPSRQSSQANPYLAIRILATISEKFWEPFF